MRCVIASRVIGINSKCEKYLKRHLNSLHEQTIALISRKVDMRSDMHKVIVERPRVAHYGSWVPAQSIKRSRNFYRKAKHFKLLEGYDVIDDFCGKKLPMKSKHLGYRFKGLKGSPTLQHHVLLHVSLDVDVHTEMTDDGRVVSADGFRSASEAGRGFYVHPLTRVLCCGAACPF
jgi:hypothetical protein